MKFSEETERTVVGLVLLYPEKHHEIFSELEDNDFYRYKNIFVSAKKLYENKEIVDIVTISDKIGDKNLINNIVDYTKNIGIAENIKHYIKILKKNKQLREIQLICKSVLQEIDGNESDEPIELSDKIISNVKKINIRQSVEFVSMDVKVKTWLNKIEDCYKKNYNNISYGLRTNIQVLDDALAFGGAPRGAIFTVGAASSRGKSAFAQTLVRNFALNGNKGIYCSFEDSSTAMTVRSISSFSDIENRKLQRGEIEEKSWPIVFDACKKVSEIGKNIKILDDRSMSIEKILMVLNKYDFDFVIFDYLQLITATGYSFRNEQSKIDYVFDKITEFSCSHPKTSIILISQLRRWSEGPPHMSYLYHSGKIEQGSHTVALIWSILKNDMYRVVDIAKQKDGPIQSVVLHFDTKTTTFKQPDQDGMFDYQKKVNNYLKKRY